MNIEILDCTLRDGGYLNNWGFSQSSVMKISKYLDLSGIDKIELGYLSNKNSGFTKFNSIRRLESFIKDSDIEFDNELWLMMNYGEYNLKDLEKSSIITGIRIAFRKENIVNIEEAVKEISLKGYKISLQPMITNNYSYSALDVLINMSNEYEVESLYIVDSFGSMSYEDVNRIFNYMDKSLDPNIKIGFHGHNNLGLVEFNALNLANNKSSRKLVLDTTLFGVGRGGGNLSTEGLISYINKKVVLYSFENIFNALEILSVEFPELEIKKKIFYFICGLYNCHPSYASEFVKNSVEFHLRDAYKLLEKFKNKDK
jgi:4-hydroxy 2-oxovalerate aldolase